MLRMIFKRTASSLRKVAVAAKFGVIVSGLFCSVVEHSCYADDSVPWQYFGAEAPGKVPVLFAPEVFPQSNRYFGVSFSVDGKECFYGVGYRNGDKFQEEIRWVHYEDGAWSPHQVLLSVEQQNYVDPFLSFDGKRLYFISTRPLQNGKRSFDIWYLLRPGDGWSEPVNVGPPVSTENANEFYVSMTSEKTLYFGSNKANPKNFDLYASRLGEDGVYQDPERLRGRVNTPHYEADVFVMPDESAVIFCSSGRDGGMGRGDLHVSFRDEDGVWSEALNLGVDVNTEYHEFAPSVSPDGKYLFFSRGSKGLMWVDASLISDLRKQQTR